MTRVSSDPQSSEAFTTNHRNSYSSKMAAAVMSERMCCWYQLNNRALLTLQDRTEDKYSNLNDICLTFGPEIFEK